MGPRLLTTTVWFISLVTSVFSAEEDDRRTLIATPLNSGEHIVLDGVLDEPVWQRAAVAEGFRQRLPREREGLPASEQTKVRIVFDDEYIYVGAILTDTHPETIVSGKRARDSELETDDLFSIALDPFGDGRSGYLFETNPAGVLRDGLLGAINPNYAWTGIWDVRTSRVATGWVAEFALPVRMLNFPADRAAWRINFRRVLRRNDEESLWTAHRPQQGIGKTRFAGDVQGLTGLSQGRGLLFTPYVVAVWRSDTAGRRLDSDAGFDLTYNITPNLRAALTLNTDFAATEVDDRVVNLSRLPLFVPEKRDFFLEGSDMFTFPGRDKRTPFYSRRIGTAKAGPVQLLAGAKLAGKIGSFDLGLLQVRTRPAFGRDAEDFSVARAKARFGNDDYAGFLYTRRAGDESTRQTLALDGRVTLLDLGGGQIVTSTPYVILTSGGRAQADANWIDRSVLGHDFSWGGSSLHITHCVAQVGDRFDPAVGFTDATAFRDHYLWVDYEYAPALRGTRRLKHAIEFDYRTDLHNRLIEGITWIGPWTQEFDRGDCIDNWEYIESFNLDVPFEIWPGVVVPAGRYDRFGGFCRIKTATRRWWWLKAEVRHGGFYNGRRTMAHLDVKIRPLPGLETGLESENHFVSLPAGDFISRLHRFRLTYSFSTRHKLGAIAQFDNRSNAIGLQAQFRWTIRPGSEIFVGYKHDWDRTFEEERGWTWRTRGRETAVKTSWSWSY